MGGTVRGTGGRELDYHTKRGLEPRLRREALNLRAGTAQLSRQGCGFHLEM